MNNAVADSHSTLHSPECEGPVEIAGGLFSNLGEEIMELIFQNLGLMDLVQISLVCKAWVAASGIKSIWKELRFKQLVQYSSSSKLAVELGRRAPVSEDDMAALGEQCCACEQASCAWEEEEAEGGATDDEINLTHGELLSWQAHAVRGSKIDFEEILRVCKKYSKATELDLCRARFPVQEPTLTGLIRVLGSLQKLVLTADQFSVGTFAASLCRSCPNLRVLAVRQANVNCSDLPRVELCHSELRELSLHGLDQMVSKLCCPQLQLLSTEQIPVPVTFFPRSHNVSTLICKGMSCVETFLPQLTSFFPNLVSLDVRYDWHDELHIESDAVRSLVDLKIGGASVAFGDFEFLKDCAKLETLHFRRGTEIWPAVFELQMPLLKVLRIDSGVYLFSILRIVCPNLEHFSFCNWEEKQELRYLEIKVAPQNPVAPVVPVAIHLQSLVSLEVLSISCPGLISLNLTGCKSVPQNLLSQVCRSCSNLKSLVLDSCLALKDLDLTSPSLTSLSLYACATLTSLHLDCPNLDSIRTVSEKSGGGVVPYPALIRVTLRCPSLESLDLRGAEWLQFVTLDCCAMKEFKGRCKLLPTICPQYRKKRS